ncbi:cyclin-U4-1 [Achaetomium macrosporum]|uniref:Cyclin-U4-1 n=1 Tax=Achaetomium macrosporum TaxID=79813 RepID=A0AAN7H4D3_9PEZI|nr:cyclin-U4-1 [Achaetomium macrosporum]
MGSLPTLSPAELNAAALEYFVYQPVDKKMIRYLAKAATDVIQCDPNMMPPPAQTAGPRYTSPPREAAPRAVRSSDGALPTVEEFITQLVISSNVQVPTLMSSLVYLRRLKSRLQPMAKGLRCTTHRIFLASLILAAKYLNDSSPKNKHWANYSAVSTHAYNFGFSRTEVNLMEKQLLFLLDWDLRITEQDLYYELDHFLAPIRTDIEARHARRMRKKYEQEMRERQLQEERLARQREREEEARLWRALAQPQQPSAQTETQSTAYATPPSSRGSSRSRQPTYTPSHSRGSSRDVSPPGLYSSNSSYAGSTSSRATTPLSEADITTAHRPYIYDAPEGGMCDSPVVDAEVYERPAVPEKDPAYILGGGRKPAAKQMLPYEISADDLRSLEESGRGGGVVSAKRMRGVLGRVFGGVASR